MELGLFTSVGQNFYYKIRINGKAKTQLLLDRNDQPVTTRQEAEKAAALLQPILRAQQKEEIALYVADAKNLKKRSELTIDDLSKAFLDNYKRRNVAPKTIKVYQHCLFPACRILSYHICRHRI